MWLSEKRGVGTVTHPWETGFNTDMKPWSPQIPTFVNFDPRALPLHVTWFFSLRPQQQPALLVTDRRTGEEPPREWAA